MKIFNLIITTKKDLDLKLSESFVDGFTACNKIEEDSKKVQDKATWSAINPVIHDLEKLRANTWDQDKITHIQNWLKDNFEVEKE